MIVRIATEGQYELSDDDTAELNELDNKAVAACDGADDANFHAAFTQLLDYVRSQGTPVPDDLLAPSDVIIPPPDVSLEEARAEFSGEGLIPGSPGTATLDRDSPEREPAVEFLLEREL